jgi:hypothetical protein
MSDQMFLSGAEIPANLGDMIDDSLYETEQARTPIITWHGRAKENTQEHGGFFAIKAADLAGLGEPLPYWERGAMRFGSDPSAELEDVYISRHLRAVLLGVRKRQIITTEDGREYYFPWFTRKDQRFYVQRDAAGNVVSRQLIDGKYTAHYQAMLAIPGIAEPVVLALRGFTKTTCWDNNPNGKFGAGEFPAGVEQVLGKFVATISKERNTRYQAYCTWFVDLVPAWKTAEKLMWIKVYENVYMNPFVCTMITGKEGYPASRFVGVDLFMEYQALRKERVVDWELEWSDGTALAQASGGSDEYLSDAAASIDNDEIPVDPITF